MDAWEWPCSTADLIRALPMQQLFRWNLFPGTNQEPLAPGVQQLIRKCSFSHISLYQMPFAFTWCSLSAMSASLLSAVPESAKIVLILTVHMKSHLLHWRCYIGWPWPGPEEEVAGIFCNLDRPSRRIGVKPHENSGTHCICEVPGDQMLRNSSGSPSEWKRIAAACTVYL